MASGAQEMKGNSRKRVGSVKGSLLGYVTPWMIGLLILLGTIITTNIEPIAHNFSAGHKALNATIIAVFFAGIIQTTYNNYRLWQVALFLRRLDDLSGRPDISENDITDLKDRLEGRASLLNLKQSQMMVDRLATQGHVLMNDNDARLIKSKFGYRTKAGRSSVSFLTGILVMFGLIGTFWGLLETIGAVASALDKIAKSSDTTAGAADMDMGAIIGAISGPLQGMGLAFSASLFGLASSLILGFYNHIAAAGQNGAIEDISRWLDERIPSPVSTHVQKGQTLKPQEPIKDDDLKAWLASYSFLSHRTEYKLGKLYESLTSLGQGFSSMAKAVQSVSASQEKMNALLQSANAERVRLSSFGEAIADRVQALPQSLQELKASAKDLRVAARVSVRHLEQKSSGSAEKQSDGGAQELVLARALAESQKGIEEKLDQLIFILSPSDTEKEGKSSSGGEDLTAEAARLARVLEDQRALFNPDMQDKDTFFSDKK